MSEKIIVENVYYHYPGMEEMVLQDISFTVRDEKVVAVLGPNGSGKTTLMRLLLGFDKPVKGEIKVLGRAPTSYDRREYARIVSWVPQEPHIPYPFTILEYVLLGRTPHVGYLSAPRERDVEKALDVLELLGLKKLANRPVTKLSGGQKRLVVIARALAQEPRILFLDEPTSHLDLGNKHLVLRILRKLAYEEKILVVYTTHDPWEALRLSDRVLVLYNGRILAYQEPGLVVTREFLERIYGIRFMECKCSDGRFFALPEY